MANAESGRPKPQLEAMLDLLGRFVGGPSIVTAFRRHADLENCVPSQYEENIIILAPVREFPDDVTLIFGNRKTYTSPLNLRIGVYFTHPEAFLTPPDELDDRYTDDGHEHAFCFIDIGYDLTTDPELRHKNKTEEGNSMLDFGVRVTFPDDLEDFEPTKPKVRWALTFVNEIGEAVEQHIDQYGLPPSPEITQEELNEAMDKMI